MTYDNVAVGNRIPADFTTGAAARRFGRKCAIWRQRINNGCGWRQMEDRGSPAANQMDHPHISLYEQGGWLRPGDSVGGMTLVYNEKPLARPSSGRLCAGTTSWWRRERLTIWTEAGGARRAPRGTRPSAFPYGGQDFRHVCAKLGLPIWRQDRHEDLAKLFRQCGKGSCLPWGQDGAPSPRCRKSDKCATRCSACATPSVAKWQQDGLPSRRVSGGQPRLTVWSRGHRNGLSIYVDKITRPPSPPPAAHRPAPAV